MIIGVGIDLVEISRVKRLMEGPSGERFVQRILTPEELRLAEDRKGRLHEYVAGRFAAKEAVAKALACGIGRQVGFQDIEILPDPLGKPECSLSAVSLHRLKLGSGVRVHLSITHTSTNAAAYVIAEQID
ncbi:holo-[acyl-carrier-protein] synthase [Paenibacillus sp. J31TS4]|uniref:holo-ACP synthase n=1 Tax=Paenibacillus sp. J31TS4 TaxID=2807195 RepID=UPI001B183DBD|nr:holo-ACP synthase [Paenibacillus sp. J31TS4]GIP41062.1 holo-[acyl-carrier-protein] synthase [Paenibacillus sp. J31TS4]